MRALLPTAPAVADAPEHRLPGAARSADPVIGGGWVRAWMSPSLVLFGLLLCVPTGYNALRLSLFALALGEAAWRHFARGEPVVLDRRVAALTAGYAVLGLMYGLYGWARGNPGAVFSLGVHALWPLVYLVFIGQVSTAERLDRLLRLCVWCTLIVSALVLAAFGVAAGVLPAAATALLPSGDMATMGGGVTHFRSGLPATLIFVVPFLVGLVLVDAGGGRIPVSRVAARVALAAGVLAALLSGRRAVILVVLAAPVLGAGLWAWRARRGRAAVSRPVLVSAAWLAAAVVLAALVAHFAFGFTPEGQAGYVRDSFDAGRDRGAVARFSQLTALLDGWRAHPLFGTGLGAPVEASTRNAERPWMYELQYVLLLYHTGVVGALTYAAGAVWTFTHLLRLVRAGAAADVALPLTLGWVSAVAANASNPYFQAYGQLWMFFLPIAAVNLYLRLGRRTPPP